MGERVCRRDDLEVGELRVMSIRGRDVAVARGAENQYYAVRNVCPHQGAPLGRGYMTGTFLPSAVGEYRYGREGEILRCPWHRWEFDIATGRSMHDPQGCRVATYTLRVEGEYVEVAD